MNDKKDIMVTTLPDGTKEEVEVLLAFKFNDNSKEYVVYTKNEVDDNGNVVTKEEGSEAYYKLLELLNDVLDDYSMKDADGNPVDTSEKRIYAPNVVGIVNGKADKMTTGISSLQTDGYMELTEEMINETYEKFKCIVNCVLDSKAAACPLDKGC